MKSLTKKYLNALVKKIEILTPAHFVLELKSGMRVEEIGEVTDEASLYF